MGAENWMRFLSDVTIISFPREWNNGGRVVVNTGYER